MKKILSIVLAAVLTLTSLPAGTAYAFEGGDVSYSDAEETVVAEETVITEETTDESSYDSVPSGDSAGNEEADVTDNDETTDTEITYDDATPDENGFTWNGYTITKYTGTAKEVVIPAKCMEIGNDAFSGNTTITKVTFEENSKCTTIGSQAFYNCKSLASITFPDKLTTIGSNAFYQDALTSVIIPSKVKTIGAVAFSKNASLSSVTILSNNIAKIDYPYQSFYGCSISTITWGENVNKIPGRLFSEAGFASDMKIVIPARFTEIGEGAFYKTSITGLSFEEGSKLTDIGAEAFNQCAGIQSLVLPKSVKTIGGCAFKQNNLSEIVIPENVTTIENSAFKQNKNLKKVTIESNGIVATYDIFAECAISEVKFSEDMTAIPKYLFNRAGFAAGCVITIPQKVQTIGDYSFTNTIISGIVFAPGSVLTSIGENAFANCIYIDEIAFPESLTTIGRYAFNSCSLEELTIPSKVTSIGQQAFENNKGLSKVVINSNAEGAWSIFGNCCIEELVFGDNVTSIGKYLFYYQGSDPDTKSGFDSNCIVTIPKGVKTIDEGAFSRSGFAELRFEEGSQLTAIGDKAFYQCVNLEKVTLPESLETIGVYAFSECNLEEITIPKNVKKIGMWAFATNKYLSKVVVLSNVLDIPMDGSGFGGTFTGCAIEELILSGSMKTIAPRIFSQTGFAANTSVVLPSGITKIGYESFASCTKMTDIYMGSKVSEIGERAFSGCESTLTIHAPKGSYAINWAKKHGFKYEEITVYKITYELNGGTNSAENPGEYMSGKEVKFATPSKTGCTFLGWFTNKDFAEGTQISHIIGNEGKDITIYAKWQVNNYTIHFETNEPAVGSCTGTVADIAAEYGKEYTNPSGANKFTFERYTQTGWNTKADGSGTSYALDAKFKNLTGENGATVTLYAQWEGANIVVSFDTNKGKTSTGRVTFSGKDYTTAYGKAMTIPATKPSSSGHEFFGWSFEQDSAVPDITLEMLGNQLDDSVRRAIESHALGGSDKVTLYAVWRSAVSEVKLTTYAETMYPGGTMEIYAIVSPDDVVTKEVTWKSSDERIATVTNESIGRTIVTAHKSGTVKITATSKATGHISATATITVATKITSLEVKVKGKTDTEALLQTGKTVQLEVVFNGGIEKPSNTNVIYDSEDSTVATVSATGLVTAKSGGIVWISARSAADPHVSTRFSVEVYDPVKSIELNTKKLKLCDGDSYQFFETVKPNTASEVGVEWSVSDISVADVTKDGLVTAHLPSGKTNAKVTVTATAKDGSGKKASCVITVGPKLETISLKAPKNYKVFINGAPAIAAGKSIKLSASFTPGNAVNKDVVWSSSNPSLATVDTKGNVKGISAGFAEITATHPYNSSVNTKQLVYVYVPVTKISLNASKLDMRAGNKFSLKATTNDGITLTDADGNVNPAQITWTSSDENVATVNESGVVTALPLGGKTAASATITASVTTDGNVTKTAKCTINVKANEVKVSKVTLNKTKLSLGINGGFKLTANVTPLSADNTEVNWISSNPAVAKVDASGFVSAVSEGETKITAVSTDGSNKSASCKITVGKEIISLTLTGKERLAVGKTMSLKAKLTPSSGNKVANSTVTYTSSNPEIATVNAKGVVKALKPGAVSITAKAEERVDGEPKQDTIVISTYIPVSAVKADVKELTVSEGSTGWIKLRSISPSNATDKSFTWKSSNPKVLEIKDPRQDTVYFAETVIDHGEVMAVEYHAILGGTATLTGTANDGSGKKIVIKVKVLGKIHNGDTKIKVKNLPKKATVENNESDTVTVDNLKIKDKFTIDPILTSTASDKRVTFRSTNPGVATVDSKGKVVIKNKGTAVISMSTADGGYQASVTVKVP